MIIKIITQCLNSNSLKSEKHSIMFDSKCKNDVLIMHHFVGHSNPYVNSTMSTIFQSSYIFVVIYFKFANKYKHFNNQEKPIQIHCTSS